MYLQRRTGELQFGKSNIITGATINSPSLDFSDLREEVPFGYCTEFLLKGENLAVDDIRKTLKDLGESLIVTGDSSTVKVRIHSLDPSPVIHYALTLGTISAVSLRNMDEQYEGPAQNTKGGPESGGNCSCGRGSYRERDQSTLKSTVTTRYRTWRSVYRIPAPNKYSRP